VQSKRTMGFCSYAFMRMVAWKSVFLLQGQETNEVFWSGSHFAGSFAKLVPMSEADDVV